MSELEILYRDHLNQLLLDYQSLLKKHNFEYLIIASGELQYAYLDDREYPFCVNPQFKALVPLTNHPGSYIVVPASGKATVIYFQAEDYWFPVAQAPKGFWVDQFNVEVVRTSTQAHDCFPKSLAGTVFLGELNDELSRLDFAAHNPEALVNEIHWRRAYKSAYELACIKLANEIAVKAHNVAKDVFYADGSEMDVHYAYIKAAQIREGELPYTNIIGFNEHAAVLHYTEMQTTNIAPDQRKSFLIDAGVYINGYASDITRTYAYKDCEFAGLVAAFDEMEQGIIASIEVGESYIDLHLRAHLKIAEVLQSFGFVNMSPESMVETGVSSVFFPHGLGHFLGLQVHDIGGHQLEASGGVSKPPEAHRYLRNTRKIEAGQVFTIEPGLYFIDMLLAGLKGGSYESDLNWEKINHFRPFGGVRIEDDVYVSDQGVINITRDAFSKGAQ